MKPTLALAAVGLLSALAPSQHPYGRATPGSGGFEPRLSAPRAWIGNAGFAFDIRCGLGNTLAAVLLAARPGSQTVLGAEVLVDLGTSFGSLNTQLSPGGAGQGFASAALPLTFPIAAALVGVPVYAQAVLYDPGSPAGFVAASRGLRVDLTLPPLVFVRCSIASGDPYQIIDPATGTIVDSGAPPQVDNTTDAIWGRGGTRIYVASSIGRTVGIGDATTMPVQWSTLYASSATCYGLDLDPFRDLLWTITDPGNGGRELTAIDADESSATFGQIVHNTSGMVSTTLVERFDVSPSGLRAAALTYLPSTLTIVDLDPSSPTFLQNLVSSVPVPTDQPSPLTLANNVEITPDDRFAMVIVQLPGQTPAEIARWDLAAGGWFDHNPVQAGQQNLGPFSQPPVNLGSAPVSIRISGSGTFAIASGFGTCGWVGRLDLDVKDPSAFGYTAWQPNVSLQNAWAADLSGDETEVGITTWPSSGCAAMPSPQLVRLDARSGALLGTVPIPFNSNGPTSQNLYTVVYR